MSEIILQVENLTKEFPNKAQALRGLSFELFKGETLGIVGESGCGKSTLGRVLLRLIEPSSGKINFKGENLLSKSNSEMRALRRQIQIVFQDPFASLNPRMTIGEVLREPLEIHSLKNNKQERRERALELLDLVGLRRESIDRYPHEFSGGQRQRVGIARALAVEPELLIFDEPVSALDVSIQAQIINLLVDLQKKLGLTYIFIAHDLRVVEYISDRIAVMYLGEIVEMAATKNLFKHPMHPYTKALLAAIPTLDPRLRGKQVQLTGEIPSTLDSIKGCAFSSRCSLVQPRCLVEKPSLEERENSHWTSCFFNQ